ncbi:MAG: cyclic nucleotide-binding domain-containing protein [Rhodospirillaceae bacterium]|nr:cyclic nucleotide-binding domain-containing protein [Rhodospirillaceae bacterium]MBT4939075.1 cyclic nucleotide-binding domain-containing protein [Rhodospirillaceae bacterium]MBT5938476.1 cyclic nucleotide-binding domain-containing protein [Rhodospirillaceae bacterium]
MDKNYTDGEIIFREGDASSSAFVIVSGQVELLKNTSSGPVNGMVCLAILSAGEIIGEMGIVDRSARSATARAVGSVTLDVIEREGFLASLKEQPDVALTVIGNLAERLRNSNEMAVRPKVSNAAPTKLATLSTGSNHSSSHSSAGALTLWDAILSLFTKPLDKRRLLEFRVARLVGDEDGSQTNLLVRALSNQPELRVKAYEEPLPVEDTEERSASFLQSALSTGRQWLAKDKADLLIWGDVNEVGTVIHLRFASHGGEADHPGGFLISDRLALPTNFDPEFGKLLYAVAVAAVVPRTEAQRHLVKPLLLPALEAAQQAEQEPPHELVARDQATIQVCYGNVTALIGHYMGDPNWLRKAATAYQEVLEAISKDADPIAYANVQYHLYRIRQVLGERGSDPEILQAAATGFEELLELFSYGDFPREWACLQSRIGSSLYRLDAINGETALLKNSIAAYQSSLHVFTKLDAPLKWSEVKNNLAQALQVWGDLARNTEILERAVAACQEALQVRNRLETPMLWAATQNNLGSALFLLGRLTEDSEHLEGAAESFGKALEIYQLYGAARLSRVTDRNMTKAENLLRARLARRVAKVYWDGDEVGSNEELSKSRRDQIFRNEIENHAVS